MTGLIHAGAVPAHCPRMPSGVWGSISISYLCRRFLRGLPTLMSDFLLLKRSHTPTPAHTWSLPSGRGLRTVLPQPPMAWPLSPLPVTHARQPTASAQAALAHYSCARGSAQPDGAVYTHGVRKSTIKTCSMHLHAVHFNNHLRALLFFFLRSIAFYSPWAPKGTRYFFLHS